MGFWHALLLKGPCSLHPTHGGSDATVFCLMIPPPRLVKQFSGSHAYPQYFSSVPKGHSSAELVYISVDLLPNRFNPYFSSMAYTSAKPDLTATN